MIYAGIDPGKKGGICLLNDIKYIGHNIFDPFTIVDVFEYDITDVVFCLEKVHSMPGQGVSSVFSFGSNYGWWTGLKDIYTKKKIIIQFDNPSPQKWMKHFNCITVKIVGESSYCRKKRHKLNLMAKAISIFPNEKELINIDNADSFLIAKYCRDIYGGK